MIDRLRKWAESRPWLGFLLRLQDRFTEVNGGPMASALTLASFLSIFPLILVGIAVLGYFSAGADDLADDIIVQFGLGGEAATALTSAIDQAEQSRRSASIIGFAGLLWSGLGVVAVLQSTMNSVWQVQGRGLKDKLTGLAWLVGAGVLLVGSFAITAALNFLPAWLAPIGLLVGIAVNIALFLWSMRVLPNHQLGWRHLLPGAIVGGVGLEVLKVVGAFLVPRLVASSSALYGSIGTVFAILAWLFFFARLVVYAATVNVVRWEREHGTVSVAIDVPRLPGAIPLRASRSGDVKDKSQVAHTDAGID